MFYGIYSKPMNAEKKGAALRAGQHPSKSIMVSRNLVGCTESACANWTLQKRRNTRCPVTLEANEMSQSIHRNPWAHPRRLYLMQNQPFLPFPKK